MAYKHAEARAERECVREDHSQRRRTRSGLGRHSAQKRRSVMYKIIGGDQQEYGPVAADEIRRWIREGRLNARSLARSEGTAEWKPLGDLPEFSAELQAQATAPAPAAPPPMHAEAWTAEVLAREPQVRVGECLSRSWHLMTSHFGLLLGACSLVWIFSVVPVVLGFIPVVQILGSLTGLVYAVFFGVLYGGLYLVFLKTIRGEQTRPGEALSGFNIAFGQLLLAGFLSWLLAKIGFCFCILPWIYLSVAWVFSVPLVADKRLEFWAAMELSRKVVTKVWFEMCALIIVAFIPVIVVSFVAGVKVTGTVIPLIQHAFSAGGPPDIPRMMETMVRYNSSFLALSLFTKLVLLFNLPFALGALMYAYENLFGSRTPANA